MTIKIELDKLRKISTDYQVRIEDSKDAINTLESDVTALESKYTTEVQADDTNASETFEQLEAAKLELIKGQANLKALNAALNVGENESLEAQANITLNAIADELAMIQTRRNTAIDDYNHAVNDLLVEARTINDIEEEHVAIYRNVSLVENEYSPIAPKRKDFFMKTAHGYDTKGSVMRYRHNQRMIVGIKLEKALSEALPKPSTW